MKKTVKQFKQDELVAVDWIDTCSNATGNPEHAAPVPRRTVGIFKGVKRKAFVKEKDAVSGKKLEQMRRVLVITDTSDSDCVGQEGWTAIPLPNVLSITGLMLTKKRWTQ